MQSQHITYLLDRYIRGQLTGKEQQELEELFQDSELQPVVQAELVRLMQEDAGVMGETANWEPVLQRVLSVDKTAGERSAVRMFRVGWQRWAVAAILLLLVGGGTVLFLARRKAGPAVAVGIAPATKVIVPGSNKAILTLANGQQVVLNDTQNGVIGQQGNTRVIKLDSGRLAYSSAAGGVAAGAGAGAGGGNGAAGMGGPLYNTITTPRGGQYQITLPDETKVWLNAESSLRFPTAFAGKDRSVQLTGEAYFEVAADKSKPFLVKAGSTETRVLGTHFNIMAYTDEGPVKTTLLEGVVSMGQETQSALLQPGEQGQFDSRKGIIATRAVNTRAVVAWKDGYYYFDRASMQSVMRQISRWYDVVIVYEGAVPKDEIVGKIPRTAEVSEVLHIMELIGIRFKIEGKKITVLG
jgi:transmembrane sensor